MIAIPSKGRASKTTSQRILTAATFFVPELEAEGYRGAVKNPIVAVPGNVQGITKTRNWILDHVQDQEVVFVDDDVRTAGYLWMQSERAEVRRIEEAGWIGEFQKLFQVAAGMDYRVWGVANVSAPRAMYPYRPFLWRSYVTASCMGIVNDGKTRFDERFQVKEDYELCLREIRDRGGIVAARYLFWENEHWKNAGGCAEYRSQKMEQKAINLLVKEYPGMIRKIRRGGSDFSIELNV